MALRRLLRRQPRSHFGGVDPLDVLTNASARWRMLTVSADDGFNRLWDASVLRRLTGEPGRRIDVCRDSAHVWGIPDGLRVDSGAPGVAHTEDRPIAPLAFALECAMRIAHVVGAQREQSGTVSDSVGSVRWRLHISSDSPGMLALLQRLPSLAGRVVGCVGAHCSGNGINANTRDAGRTSSASIQAAIDLFWHGAADHLFSASLSTFASFAVRSLGPPDGMVGPSSYDAQVIDDRGLDGRPLVLPAGNKRLPICTAFKQPAYPRFDHPGVPLRWMPWEQSDEADPTIDCLALRWSTLSGFAAKAIEDEHVAQQVRQAAHMLRLALHNRTIGR